MSPRPNELGGEVRPNVLSPSGGRPRPEPPVAARQTPGWSGARTATPAPNTTPVATAAARPTPASISRPAPRASRSFGIWIVLAVIAFSLLRAFAGRLSFGAGPTTAPAPAAPVVNAGEVEFGTGLDADCGILGDATSFPSGTDVWWSAQFETSLPGDASVVYTVSKDGKDLDRQEGPGGTPGDDEWNGLCAGEPLRYSEVGSYTFIVYDSTERTVLAKGSYDLVAR